MQRFETQRTIDAQHPSLAGHFPGNPVVPGVVILDCVAQALREWDDGWRIAAIDNAKFLAPLLPQQTMSVTLVMKDEDSATFECRVGDRLVAQGKFGLQRTGT